jgi:HSP20 family molecular chaperone IbpA
VAHIKVQKVIESQDRTLPIFKQIDELVERTRRRAFELFAGRGHADGYQSDDWIKAERELCWLPAELSEQEKNYVLSVALPGFEPDQVSVTATPREMIVQTGGKSEPREESDKKEGEARLLWSEFRSCNVYRRVELPAPIDVSKVSANLTNGILKIVAAKTPRAIVHVQMAVASLTAQLNEKSEKRAPHASAQASSVRAREQVHPRSPS